MNLPPDLTNLASGGEDAGRCHVRRSGPSRSLGVSGRGPPHRPVSASESVVVVTPREVHDLATGRRWELDYRGSRLEANVDRSARLWLGSDNGEWGGWVARLDSSLVAAVYNPRDS